MLYPVGRTSPSSVHVIPGRNGRTNPLGRVRVVAYRQAIPGGADLAVLLVERGFETRSHHSLGDRPLGYWSCLDSLPVAKGASIPIRVAGYPGDRCGTEPFDIDDPTVRCPAVDQSSTMWTSRGLVVELRNPTLVHTADTKRGQSGAPVWIDRSGGPCLVGIHTDSRVKGTDNIAAHRNPTVLRALRQWRTQ